MAKISVKNLSFSYPKSDKKALDNINIDIAQGEFLLVCGASGCGKTTLLRHLKSALMPGGMRSGGVYVDGTELCDIPEREQAGRIGFVFQSPDDQIVTDKVWHELAFAGESMRIDTQTIRLRCGEIAGYFDLADKYYSPVSELSGGQKQILNLASVMTLSPDILILDEPTAQLDPVAADNFFSTLKKLNEDLGVTVIISEHSLDRVFSMADRVAVMDSGAIALCGSPRETAEKIVAEHRKYFSLLPSVAQAAALGGLNGEIPLTVKDGRRMLADRRFEKELIGEKDAEKQNKKDEIISLDEIYFRYSRVSPDILKSFSLTVNRGEILGIVGGNGSGKSTALQIMAGINAAHSGRIRVNGKKIKALSALKALTAYLPQDPTALFVKDTVKEELCNTVKKDGTKPTDSEITQIVAQTELENLLDSHPFDLSGGESQRLGIAKILLTGADALLLDEPVKGIDPQMKIKFGELLRSFVSGGGSAAVVSHDMEFLARFADRCVMTFDGAVISEGKPRRFFAGNHFYTTAVNRTLRGVFPDCILTTEAAALCKKQAEKE